MTREFALMALFLIAMISFGGGGLVSRYFYKEQIYSRDQTIANQSAVLEVRREAIEDLTEANKSFANSINAQNNAMNAIDEGHKIRESLFRESLARIEKAATKSQEAIKDLSTQRFAAISCADAAKSVRSTLQSPR